MTYTQHPLTPTVAGVPSDYNQQLERQVLMLLAVSIYASLIFFSRWSSFLFGIVTMSLLLNLRRKRYEASARTSPPAKRSLQQEQLDFSKYIVPASNLVRRISPSIPERIPQRTVEEVRALRAQKTNLVRDLSSIVSEFGRIEGIYHVFTRKTGNCMWCPSELRIPVLREGIAERRRALQVLGEYCDSEFKRHAGLLTQAHRKAYIEGKVREWLKQASFYQTPESQWEEKDYESIQKAIQRVKLLIEACPDNFECEDVCSQLRHIKGRLVLIAYQKLQRELQLQDTISQLNRAINAVDLDFGDDIDRSLRYLETLLRETRPAPELETILTLGRDCVRRGCVVHIAAEADKTNATKKRQQRAREQAKQRSFLMRLSVAQHSADAALKADQVTTDTVSVMETALKAFQKSHLEDHSIVDARIILGQLRQTLATEAYHRQTRPGAESADAVLAAWAGFDTTHRGRLPRPVLESLLISINEPVSVEDLNELYNGHDTVTKMQAADWLAGVRAKEVTCESMMATLIGFLKNMSGGSDTIPAAELRQKLNSQSYEALISVLPLENGMVRIDSDSLAKLHTWAEHGLN